MQGQIFTAIEFLNFCEVVTNELVCLGILLKNNDGSVKTRTTSNVIMTSYLIFITLGTLFIEYSSYLKT
jgi:hypothetical protein